MFKKNLFLVLILMKSITLVHADNLYSGIIVTYSGAETCYKFSEVPIVTYSIDGEKKIAQLYLKGDSKPVIDVELYEDAKLTITYGSYITTDKNDTISNKVTIEERKGKKIFSGGRLIIVGKDGKLYSSSGYLINK